MAIRVFFVVLLLSYQFINVARCKSDDDGAEAAAEVAADSEELRIVNDDMVDGLNDIKLIAAPGVDTVCVFSKNSAKGMQAGEETERLVGINYDGDSSVNAVAIQASVHLPYDHRLLVQNLTAQMFNNASVPPSAKTTFLYLFAVSKSLQADTSDLVGKIVYETENTPYQSTVYNGTIEVVEASGPLTIETVFLVTLATSLVVALGLLICGQFQRLSKVVAEYSFHRLPDNHSLPSHFLTLKMRFVLLFLVLFANGIAGEIQHLGVCCPIQWRDHIIVERIVFDLDEEGVKEVSYVKMFFIPREEVKSWSHLLENLGSYTIPSYISVYVTSVLVYQHGWDWEEGAHEFTPEGYPMTTSMSSYTSGLKIDFDDYLTVLERVRVIVFPFVHKWKENKVYNPYAIDDTTVPPPPSPPFGVNLKVGNEYYLVRENERGDIIHWCVVCKNFCPASEGPGTLEAYDYDDVWLPIHSIRWTPTLRVDYIEFLSVGGRITSFNIAHLKLLQNRDTMANHLRLSLGSFWRMDSVGLLVKTGTHTWSIQVASPYLGVLSVSVGMLFLAFSGIIGWRRKRTTRHYPLTLDLSFPRWIDFLPPPKFNTFRSPLIPRLSSTSWKFDGDDEGELVDGSKSMEVTLEGGHGYKH